jgi:hypothetical protein
MVVLGSITSFVAADVRETRLRLLPPDAAKVRSAATIGPTLTCSFTAISKGLDGILGGPARVLKRNAYRGRAKRANDLQTPALTLELLAVLLHRPGRGLRGDDCGYSRRLQLVESLWT